MISNNIFFWLFYVLEYSCGCNFINDFHTWKYFRSDEKYLPLELSEVVKSTVIYYSFIFIKKKSKVLHLGRLIIIILYFSHTSVLNFRGIHLIIQWCKCTKYTMYLVETGRIYEVWSRSSRNVSTTRQPVIASCGWHQCFKHNLTSNYLLVDCFYTSSLWRYFVKVFLCVRWFYDEYYWRVTC